MIEKMKKLSLLIYHSSKERFLENLQDLGVVHIEADKSVQNDEILYLRNIVVRIEKILKFLNSVKEKEEDVKQIDYDANIENLLKEIEDKQIKLNELKLNLDNINKEIALLKIWGNFSPELIENLYKEAGLKLKFYSAIEKNYIELAKTDLIIEEVARNKGRVYFVILYKEEDDIQKVIEVATEEKIPLKSLERLEIDKEIIEEKIKKEEKGFSQYFKYLQYLEKNRLFLEDKIDYNMANLSLKPEAEGVILFITGWIPEKNLNKLLEFLNREDAAFLIEEPKETDIIPVLLKNNKFAKLFEPITKMHSLPQYTELDPTPFFAPFFAAFFGLCLADSGYGLVLFLAVIGLLLFGKNKQLRPILFLGLILSGMTIISGILLDSLFGFKFTEMKILPDEFKKFVIFSKIEDQMSFSIMLGIIQVLFGFILQIVNKVRLKGILAAFQPLGTMMLIVSAVFLLIAFVTGDNFSIGPIPVGKIILSIPNLLYIIIGLGITGTILVLLFNNLEKPIFLRPLIGLWEIYGIVTGVPGDILSYIRIFALGLAGSLLGSAFNQIAFMIKDNAPMVIGYIGMLLILIAGHTINLALSALSAFVHPLRLILLEFYKAVGFSGGGKEFVPFKRRFALKN
ncbi:MAG TPA: V-type ATPase 116kDa subunit family protein [Spirochaetota bacterium]|nr:V-type ATPase 116kDa subunit family protein [Spirochaetota bacterium]HOL56025.1 V-type ATPase 116kDa subunit family protein [Spirochaetota bacterium]HPP03467.1 V-type ATPase 116kDa subunit family protein [Spirochaetota bacterium]